MIHSQLPFLTFCINIYTNVLKTFLGLCFKLKRPCNTSRINKKLYCVNAWVWEAGFPKKEGRPLVGWVPGRGRNFRPQRGGGGGVPRLKAGCPKRPFSTKIWLVLPEAGPETDPPPDGVPDMGYPPPGCKLETRWAPKMEPGRENVTTLWVPFSQARGSNAYGQGGVLRKFQEPNTEE